MPDGRPLPIETSANAASICDAQIAYRPVIGYAKTDKTSILLNECLPPVKHNRTTMSCAFATPVPNYLFKGTKRRDSNDEE